MPLSRRALLAAIGGVGVLGAGGAIAGDRSWRHGLRQLVDPVPEPPSNVPHVAPAPTVSGSFRSAARGGRDVGWTIAYPDGVRRAGLPVALVLHGRGDSHRTVFDSHAWGRFLAAAVKQGTPPYAIAAVDGGNHTYWHRRADGDDPQRMIVDEFLPMLRARGLRTARLGVAGWSMGGYGALLLAERLGAAACAVVAVDSPALWLHPGDSAPGAFDDREDFLRNDVFAKRPQLHGVPIRVAIGTSDPFYRGARVFVRGLDPPAAVDFSPGGHDVAFWRHAAPGQIRFLGAHLG